MNILKFYQYLTRFGSISLIGLTLDILIFNVLVTLQIPIFLASLISISCAIVAVYFTSAYKLFEHASTFLFHKFFVYTAYHMFMMFLVSATLNYIHANSIPLISHQLVLKFLPLPFTFTCNALVTFLLLRK